MKTKLAILVLCLGATACYESHEVEGYSQDPGTRGGRAVINYRGDLVSAKRVGDELIIEGDIIVDESDVWSGMRHSDGGVAVAIESVKISGYQYRWPMNSAGIAEIPYEIDTDFGSFYQGLILGAMKDWEDAVPTLSFVERDSQGAYISFQQSTTNCSSYMGRIGGKQNINLTRNCAWTFRAHHEIGHALGLYHQHTRKNRSASIEVVWSNIIGCKYTAGSGGDTAPSAHCGNAACSPDPVECGCTAEEVEDDECHAYAQFEVTSSRSNIGVYDYDSVMHYPDWAFVKGQLPDGGDNLGVSLQGNPVPIGQQTHLSAGDIYAVQAMYPRASMHATYFEGTGVHKLCRLNGRRDDIASAFTVDRGTVPSGVISDDEIDTDELSVGDYTVDSCEIQSAFWQETYDYPNSSTTINFGTYPPSLVEEYSVGSTQIRASDRGLIAVLF